MLANSVFAHSKLTLALQTTGRCLRFGGTAAECHETAVENFAFRQTSRPRHLPFILGIITNYRLEPQRALSPPHSHAIHCLLNYPINDELREFWGGSAGLEAVSDRLIIILDECLQKVLPFQAGIGFSKSEHLELDGQLADDVMPPILLALRSIIQGDPAVRSAVQRKLMPEDIDRTKHLDGSDNITSRLIKLMSSIAENLKTSVSELLFTLCEENASRLISYVGYGNAAGFLFQKGLLSGGVESQNANPPPSNINPITGEVLTGDNRNEEWEKLTEEEKDRETDKLIEMFEKLEKTGIIKIGTKSE
ncbi:hypothetical protein HDU97_009702 [Phlyctochytrium planicorne]|nr:hypothetical protein HDU97_009702 [Phlyctochytrium planicorne]